MYAGRGRLRGRSNLISAAAHPVPTANTILVDATNIPPGKDDTETIRYSTTEQNPKNRVAIVRSGTITEPIVRFTAPEL